MKEPPEDLLCPITLDLMRDPVIDANGHTFDRSAIERVLVHRPGISPLTNELYVNGDARLTPNRLVCNMIDEFNKAVEEESERKRVAEEAAKKQKQTQQKEKRRRKQQKAEYERTHQETECERTQQETRRRRTQQEAERERTQQEAERERTRQEAERERTQPSSTSSTWSWRTRFPQLPLMLTAVYRRLPLIIRLPFSSTGLSAEEVLERIWREAEEAETERRPRTPQECSLKWTECSLKVLERIWREAEEAETERRPRTPQEAKREQICHAALLFAGALWSFAFGNHEDVAFVLTAATPPLVHQLMLLNGFTTGSCITYNGWTEAAGVVWINAALFDFFSQEPRGSVYVVSVLCAVGGSSLEGWSEGGMYEARVTGAAVVWILANRAFPEFVVVTMVGTMLPLVERMGAGGAWKVRAKIARVLWVVLAWLSGANMAVVLAWGAIPPLVELLISRWKALRPLEEEEEAAES
eukprot:CAMPEP_0198230584 /NCGR_PEP_ID=MMETSP1445-20131203/114746_1 /TAXON_ID=36898 /ORGANISM="Pyramimonas sp., Strain CCMP2087" /LENGTH=470 /DNA_ID=CAMNT_0043911141 /DNA_START=454 /DNA_END=1866 /DNA_ORIENTATION=-